MTTPKTIPIEKQLTIIARVEPGSLGPDGLQKIEAFCRYANLNMVACGKYFVRWQIIPRYDKTQPELEYYILHKRLNQVQVTKYLGFFSMVIDDFEEDFYSYLTTLIERYLGM